MLLKDLEQYPNEWLNTVTHEDLMSNAFPVIIDREQSDVSKLAQLSKKQWEDFTYAEKVWWYGVVKGAYNADDMNRVGYAVNLLSGRLRDLPNEMLAYLSERYVAPIAYFDVPYNPSDYADMTGKTDWSEENGDIPDEADADIYLGNVTLLRAAFDYASDPLPATMEKLGYAGANAIEKALMGLDSKVKSWQAEKEIMADKTAAAFFYSGEIFSGEI